MNLIIHYRIFQNLSPPHKNKDPGKNKCSRFFYRVPNFILLIVPGKTKIFPGNFFYPPTEAQRLTDKNMQILSYYQVMKSPKTLNHALSNYCV